MGFVGRYILTLWEFSKKKRGKCFFFFNLHPTSIVLFFFNYFMAKRTNDRSQVRKSVKKQSSSRYRGKPQQFPKLAKRRQKQLRRTNGSGVANSVELIYQQQFPIFQKQARINHHQFPIFQQQVPKYLQHNADEFGGQDQKCAVQAPGWGQYFKSN